MAAIKGIVANPSGPEASVEIGEKPEHPGDCFEDNPDKEIPVGGFCFGDECVHGEENSSSEDADEEEGDDDLHPRISLLNSHDRRMKGISEEGHMETRTPVSLNRESCGIDGQYSFLVHFGWIVPSQKKRDVFTEKSLPSSLE